jgi:hypothetical protein
MIYTFLRLGAIPLAFAGWIIYQLVFKRKKIKEISNDLLTIGLFLFTWFILIRLVFS